MASATRAVAIEKFGINGQGRGMIDTMIAGDDAIAIASASVSAARLARMALRTWIVDRWLMGICSSCTQIVVIGAGLDARCMCLPLPHTARIFELDLPIIISMKSHLLSSASCRFRSVLRVPCDLSLTSWPQQLLHAGFQNDQRTAWLCEGTAM